MFDRVELKKYGNQDMKNNYWSGVVAALLLGFAGGNSIFINRITSKRNSGSLNKVISQNLARDNNTGIYYDPSTGSPFDPISDYDTSGIMDKILPQSEFYNIWTEGQLVSLILSLIMALIVVLLIMTIIGILIKTFLLNPLAVGCHKYFIENAVQKNSSLSYLGKGFSDNYVNTFSIMFLRNLFTWLWSLLFWIPGVIKHYEYLMVPYILADHPNMPASEVFRKSRELMDGNKWDAFVMDLSFIGWWLLGIITFGLVDLFYVAPYYYATRTELYLSICPDYVAPTDKEISDFNPYQDNPYTY